MFVLRITARMVEPSATPSTTPATNSGLSGSRKPALAAAWRAPVEERLKLLHVYARPGRHAVDFDADFRRMRLPEYPDLHGSLLSSAAKSSQKAGYDFATQPGSSTTTGLSA